jgi:NADH:ubiquinone oxidoreductase subunit 4 (subunit M)
MLTMLQTVFFGPLQEPSHGDTKILDMNAREMWAIGPICALCLLIGVMPQPFLKTIEPDVNAIVSLYADTKPTVATDKTPVSGATGFASAEPVAGKTLAEPVAPEL